MLKHFVKFDTPGAFMPETVVREVCTRIPTRLQKIPDGTYALSFFDRVEMEQDGEALVGKAKNHSSRIIFGQVFTKDQLPALGYNERSSLYRNAGNTDDKVIKCNTGNWQPWDKDWIILSCYADMRQLKTAI